MPVEPLYPDHVITLQAVVSQTADENRFSEDEAKYLTLISRAPRKLTKEEAERILSEHLQEPTTIL